MEHFAILIWIKVRHIKKKRIKLALGVNTLCLNEGQYGIPFSYMLFTSQGFLCSMMSFPIHVIVKIGEGGVAKKLCLILCTIIN